MRRWHYTHFGLRIASELELPEWSESEHLSGWGSPDVVIRVKPFAQTESGDLTQQPSLMTPDEYKFHIPDLGHFHVHDGREIDVKPLPGTPPERLRPWLVGSVWGALCYQREMFIVHASAVRIGDEAVIFCGRAGQGKSTLAAQLCARGYALVGDDLCRLELPPQGSPVVHPSAPRMKLWSDALGELGWSSRDLAPDHLRQGKFHLSLPASGLTHPLPVRAAYLLSWGVFGARELHGRAALHGFLSGATWRMKLLESMGQLGPQTRRYTEFLRRVPLVALTRPRDLMSSSETLDFLAGQWSRAAV